ncbi:myomegalin-like isoform X1 [Notamacropus eugenii]|uniref:myomegalin-like isoform X3 n=1 Tax=Notamacropus eugenii TaxID=9315 RepID=UPI003B685B77
MEGSSDEDVASECTRYEEECADEAPPNHPGLSGTEISSTLLFCGFCCSRLCWEFFFTGSSSSIHMLSLESVSQLGNEIRILLAQKENLQTELKHLSQEHSRELEHVMEALLASQTRLQELKATLEIQKAEQWQMAENLKDRQQVILQF